MKLVFDTFKAIKFEEHQSRTLENAVFSFASSSSSFFSEIETAVSSAKGVLRHGDENHLYKLKKGEDLGQSPEVPQPSKTEVQVKRVNCLHLIVAFSYQDKI